MSIKFFFFIPVFLILFQTQLLVPVNIKNRKDYKKIQLTAIGTFGLVRKERKTVPSHLHTGIDIKRPGTNYNDEPIFPLAAGKVISKRTDGAYAQLIIEHEFNHKKFWTLYEHVAGIKVNINDQVDPEHAIASFMDKTELNHYGWQFDHFHLEILKVKPMRLLPDKLHPDRFYNSYSLICFKKEDLEKYYYDPLNFISQNLK
jgi:murein DD-endopeptidase MepM/ murein hydrolase activator NlpD